MRSVALLLDGDVSVFDIRVIVVQKSETRFSPNLACLKKRTSSFEDAFIIINLLYYSFPEKTPNNAFPKNPKKKRQPFKWISGAVFFNFEGIVALNRTISKLLNRVCF